MEVIIKTGGPSVTIVNIALNLLPVFKHKIEIANIVVCTDEKNSLFSVCIGFNNEWAQIII